MNKTHIGKIYLICNCINDKVFINSTLSSLTAEWHAIKKTKFKMHKYIYNYMSMFGEENFAIVLLKKIKVSSKKELDSELQKEMDKWPRDSLYICCKINFSEKISKNNNVMMRIINKLNLLLITMLKYSYYTKFTEKICIQSLISTK